MAWLPAEVVWALIVAVVVTAVVAVEALCPEEPPKQSGWKDRRWFLEHPIEPPTEPPKDPR